MDANRNSPEHHFLTFLEELKPDPSGWVGMHFQLSAALDHNMVMASEIPTALQLSRARKTGLEIYQQLKSRTRDIPDCFSCHFLDNDIILLNRPSSKDEQNRLQDVYADIKKHLPDENKARMVMVGHDFRSWQKLADEKLVSYKRIGAYQTMSDDSRMASIPLRRKRRDEALILIVEDDRFTASYAASLLNHEFDIIHCRTGEEAITSYIEDAPDAVLLDIHLPGINGHQTLQAIRRADPEAFVIMLSVDTERNSVMCASKLGANGFLKKPFSKDRLVGTVKKSPFVRRQLRAHGEPGRDSFTSA